MIIILSPAKNMKISKYENFNFENIIFKKESHIIYNELKKLNPQNIEALMKVNEDIALKTFINIQDFDFDRNEAHALKSYDGLVFKNINSEDFTDDELIFANSTIRILSGFYGVLTPFTSINPYRLEMGLKIKINDYSNLYKFWYDKIYNEIFKNNDLVLNLASKEYTKCIEPFLKENDNFINVDFLSYKNGKYKTTAILSKILRGQMTRYIIKNKIKDTETLKKFNFDGFYFNKALSNSKNFIFTN